MNHVLQSQRVCTYKIIHIFYHKIFIINFDNIETNNTYIYYCEKYSDYQTFLLNKTVALENNHHLR